MTSTFDLIADDFDKELRTARRLLNRSYAESPTTGAVDSDLRIAASNATMLLLAASFEEFIRECVKEYVSIITKSASNFSDIPEALVGAVWERSLFLMNGSKFGKRNFDRAAAVMSMRNLQYFCLMEDHSVDISNIVSYNRNNMRTAEINQILSRVGISDYCGSIGRNSRYIDFFGSPDENKAHSDFISHLDGFYDTRNEIAHSIGALRTTGVTEIDRHVDFFLITGEVIASDFNLRAANAIS